MEGINGHIILLMGPTGSGKGSIVKYVRKLFPKLQFVVSCTTREKRPNEVEETDYFYISKEEFDKKIDRHEFLEWAEFSGNRYGTLKSEIVDRLKSKQVILHEIELQGVLQLMELIPEDNRTLVYIESGDWEELKTRAMTRAPISGEHLKYRHKRYFEEIKMKPYADIVIENYENKLVGAQKSMEKVIKSVFDNISI